MVQRVNSPGFSYDWRQHHEAGPQPQQQSAPMSLADAVHRIGDYAASGHTRYVSDRDLLEIAANEHGQFPPDLQEAAQLRFDYGHDFDLVRRQLVAEERRPHSRLSQYCYQYQDLLAMSGRLRGASARVADGVLAAGFGVLEGLLLHGSRSMPEAGEYRNALEGMARQICDRDHTHMSFETLMALRGRGNRFAQVLIRDVKAVHRLFHKNAPRNKAFNVQEMEREAARLDQEQRRAAAAAGRGQAVPPQPVFAQPRPEPAPSPQPAPIIEEVDDSQEEANLSANRMAYARQALLKQQNLAQERARAAQQQQQDVQHQQQHAADIRRWEQQQQDILHQQQREQELRLGQQRQDDLRAQQRGDDRP